jgi:segregation and condensation protein A
MLLPREKIHGDQVEDPRQILVDRLLDYQKIKAASLVFCEKESEEFKKWKRTFLPPSLKEEDFDFIEVSLFDLAESFFNLLKRKGKEAVQTIEGKEYTIEEKMKEILAILKKNSFLDFLDYLDQKESFEEAFISFFSLLELIKSRLVLAVQEKHFEPIKVWLRSETSSKGHR